MIIRELYLNKLRGYRDKQLIKIITGIRRCGKSTLLEQFQQELLEEGVSATQIIAINFEDMDFQHLLTAEALYAYIKPLLGNQKNYIFLDEVQMVANFERVVDSLFIKKNIDVYITGSNASMLSGEIATLLSGRYVEINILPLSFKEFVSACDSTISTQKLYNRYLTESSFPYVLELDENKMLIRGYLEGIFNTVILKDIVARKRITDVMMLESVIRFLFDSIGSVVSIKKISDTMTSSGRKISPHTIESYISGLLDSYILHQVKRYDIKGKQHLKTLEKYYLTDVGLRYYLLGNKGTDIGHILENIIYLELIRKDYDVYIGKVGQYEVDFIAISPQNTIYIQVAASIRDENTLARELRPLQSINDHYPKVILTLDEDPEMNYDGIRVLNALQYILDEV